MMQATRVSAVGRDSGLRLRQLWRAIAALRRDISPADAIDVSTILGDADYLFFDLPRYEQRHALNVLHTLQIAGQTGDSAVLQAALLHDVGKTDHSHHISVPLWLKVVNVLLQKTLGAERTHTLLERIGTTQPGTWRYVFTLQAHHERRGAEIVQQAGLGEHVAALIGQCRDLACGGDVGAQALQWADDLN